MDPLSFVFSIAATMLAFMIFTQAVDTELTLAVKAAFMSIFVFGGIVFRAIALGGFNFKPLSVTGWLYTVIGTAVAFIAIVAMVFIVPPAAAVSLPDRLFYANMAIVETVFFVYFLFGWLCTLFPWPVAALATGLIFAPFHIGVYGWNPAFMVFAVFAMVIFCAVYYITTSLFTAMGAHILFNLMASAASLITPGTFVLGGAIIPAWWMGGILGPVLLFGINLIGGS